MLRPFFPLFSPDDPAGGDPPTTPDPPPAGGDDGDDGGGDDAGGGGERTFTQKDVDRLIADARRKERQKLSKQPAKKKPTKKASEPEGDGAPSTEERIQRMLDFRDVAGDHELSRKQRKRLENEFLNSGSDDAESWLADAVEEYGLVKPQPDNPGAESDKDKDKPTSTPARPPASDRGGPAAPPDSAVMDNPMRWGQEHVDSIVGSKKTRAEGLQELRRQFVEKLNKFDYGHPRRQ